MTLSSDTSLQPIAVKQDRRQVIFISLAACLIFWVFVLRKRDQYSVLRLALRLSAEYGRTTLGSAVLYNICHGW
jgi:hypothetical protein